LGCCWRVSHWMRRQPHMRNRTIVTQASPIISQ
jgi:hypothetical protein